MGEESTSATDWIAINLMESYPLQAIGEKQKERKGIQFTYFILKEGEKMFIEYGGWFISKSSKAVRKVNGSFSTDKQTTIST